MIPPIDPQQVIIIPLETLQKLSDIVSRVDEMSKRIEIVETNNKTLLAKLAASEEAEKVVKNDLKTAQDTLKKQKDECENHKMITYVSISVAAGCVAYVTAPLWVPVVTAQVGVVTAKVAAVKASVLTVESGKLIVSAATGLGMGLMQYSQAKNI
jgi:Flp pilus assembly protein TadB